MSYDYSPNEVLEIANRVYDRNLSCPAQFFTTPGWKLRAVYNGIGPDAWSSRCRKLVTSLLEKFTAPAMVHDWEYTFCPKNYWFFTVANMRFAVNSFIDAFYEKRGSRYIIKQTLLGIALALLCQLFGYKGYKTAKEVI